MNTILRFGSGSKLYTFPTSSQITFTDDFAKLNNKLIRLPGLNGSFSQLGTGRGQSVGGTVRIENWLEFADLVEASDKVDSLRQMADWGLQPLYMQPTYGPERFCFARLNDQPLNQDVHNVPHLRQKVPVVFDVPDPFWYRKAATFGKLWDDGTLWDDGSNWDADIGYTVSFSATYSFSNGGNTYTLPRIFLDNSSGSDVSEIRVQRIVDGAVEDEVFYAAALPSGSYLDIHPAARRVTVLPAATSGLNNFTAKHPDWMRLMPGSNSLKFTCGGGLTLYMQYLERFI